MIYALALLCSLANAQEASSGTAGISLYDNVKISNLGKSTRDLLSGRYTQTGLPTFLGGANFKAPVTASGATGNIVSGASITASAFFGYGGNLTGISGTQISTWTAIVSSVTISTVKGVCYATATLVSNGGRVTLSFSGNISNTNATDQGKVSVLVDGDYIEPYKTFGGNQVAMAGASEGSSRAVGFSVTTLSALSAGSHTFCLAAWRSAGTDSVLRCGSALDEPNCVLNIHEIK